MLHLSDFKIFHMEIALTFTVIWTPNMCIDMIGERNQPFKIMVLYFEVNGHIDFLHVRSHKGPDHSGDIVLNPG